MKLFVHANSKNNVIKLWQRGIEKIVVGTTTFSCRQAISLDYEELKELVQKRKEKQLYVLVNALIEEKYVEDLKKHLHQLHVIGVQGLFFQDFAVLQICKESKYTFDLVYAPDTLNTNQATLSCLVEQGIRGAFLAREIPLVEKIEIQECLDIPCITQIHGVEYMAYSKRKLLESYSQAINKDIEYQNKQITIQAKNVDHACYIYEDTYGTHVVTKTQLSCLDVLDKIRTLEYGFIESLYMKEEELIKVVALYQEGIALVRNNTYDIEKKRLQEELQLVIPNQKYYHSFLFDQTVYKIADVRKREENERSK